MKTEILRWDTRRARYVVNRVDVRGADAPLASATKHGVSLRDDLDHSVWNPESNISNYKLVEPDDFVVGLRSFQHGISHSTVRGLVSPAYTVLRCARGLEPRYYKYYFRSQLLISQLANITQGIRQGQSIDMEAFVDLELPVPSLEEQRRIADFLDAETARIDQLCDRYSELRRRFIERADADLDRRLCEFSASMPLKYMVAFREGPGIMAVDFQDAGIPLVRLPGLRKGEVTLHGCNYLSEPAVATRWHKFRLRLGDYIISGSATMGEVSIVRDEDVVGAVPYTGLIILRPATRGVNMSYVAAFLRSSLFSNQINLLKTGAAMQHFGPTHLSQISIPVPDDRQQSAIAEQYEKERERVVKLTGLIDRQLSLAAERRQALITAAVTGQFDETTGRGVDAS